MAQALEARFGAQSIELRNYVEEDHIVGAVIVTPVEPCDSLFTVAETDIQKCHVKWRDVTASRSRFEFIQHLQALSAFPSRRISMTEGGQHRRAIRRQ